MKQKRDLYFLLIATLILVALWVMFSIYQNLISSTISSPVATDINPIAPTFNESVLTTLKNRQQISPVFTPPQAGTNQTSTGSAIPTPSPSASTSPSPSPSVNSSSSAQTSI